MVRVSKIVAIQFHKYEKLTNANNAKLNLQPVKFSSHDRCHLQIGFSHILVDPDEQIIPPCHLELL